jgi:phage-related minor tail protein
MKSFEDYMVGIFDSISRAFADILGQMVAEWIKAQLKMQSVAAAGSGFSSALGWLGGLLGGLGGGVGGPGPVVPGGNPADIFKAEGGPVKAGAQYIVGEKGPELFIPDSTGKIVSNQELISKKNVFNDTTRKDSSTENQLVKELFKQTDSSREVLSQNNSVKELFKQSDISKTKLNEFFKTDTFKKTEQITPFAKGGIVDKPTIFPFASGVGLMGESGPEAVMPLTRTSGGKLGVAAEGTGQTINQYDINIHAVDAASFADMLERNPEAIISQVTSAADAGHGGLRQSMRDIIK